MANSAVGFSEDDLESIRERLRSMNDAALERQIRAGEYMVSPRANMRKPPRETFVVQLREARAERERRKAAAGLYRDFFCREAYPPLPVC